MHEMKTENVYEDFSSDKKMFDFSSYSTKSKNYNDSNKLVIGKMKDETGGDWRTWWIEKYFIRSW